MPDTEAQPETTNNDDDVSAPECIGLCTCIGIGPLSVLAGAVLLITAISTTHWVEYEAGGQVVMEGGLWEVCLPRHNNTCSDWDEDLFDTDYLKFAIAALIIAAIGYVLGFFLMVCFVMSALSGDEVSLRGQSSWLVAVVCNVTGVSVFTRFRDQTFNFGVKTILPDTDYSWSFHMAWGAIIPVVIGCGMSLMAGICFSSEGGDRETAAGLPVLIKRDGNPVRQDIYTVQETSDGNMAYKSETETVTAA